mmetsp:Transcript_19919/g.64158  ORF Transcript_19919/g.64158 Transcript_19919/m.64158 type:complete len:100 (-) Transcript_19919:3-302(-)
MKNNDAYRLYTIFLSTFHSMKLHIFGARPSTVAVTSRTMRDRSFGGTVSYHFVSLVFPCRDTCDSLASEKERMNPETHQQQKVDHDPPRTPPTTTGGRG